MHNVTLTKLSSNHNHLHIISIDGECVFLPIIGRIFTMVVLSLDKTKGVQYLHTTRVQDVVKECGMDSLTYMFTTRNSTYKLNVH